MDFLIAIFLGIVQGITEWLPISSSGHLVIVQKFIGVQPPLIFNIVLHLATLLVILVVFRNDLWEIVRDLFKGNFQSPTFQLLKFIILASVPIAILGYFFNDFFESLFTSPFAVGIALLINGLILFLTKFRNEKKNLDAQKSFLIGIAQAISLTPGISRSGLTISTGILSGVEKEKVIKFSFLLYLPAVLGAFLFKINSLTSIESSLVLPTIVGFITAFIVGYLSLNLLIKLVIQKKFYFFAFYCWVIGIIVLISL